METSLLTVLVMAQALLPLPPASSAAPPPAMAQLEELDVKCGRTGMTVSLQFDQAFRGVVFSKGHFYDPACKYVTQDNNGQKTFKFVVPASGCGSKGGADEDGAEMWVENTVIVQGDPIIQEVWDAARTIRCSWPSVLTRSLAAAPFSVQQPRQVSVSLDGRAVNTLMEIQKGSGPFSGPATGYVHLGDDVSVVIYVQDPKQELDVNAVSCKASSGGGAEVGLVDGHGCLSRPDLLTPFAKTRQTNGVEADIMLYSYMKAFSIGEDTEFVFSCQLEVCEGHCLEPCPTGPSRARREQPAQVSRAQAQLETRIMVLGREPGPGITGSCVADQWLITAGVVVLVLIALFAILVGLAYLGKRQMEAKKP